MRNLIFGKKLFPVFCLSVFSGFLFEPGVLAQEETTVEGGSELFTETYVVPPGFVEIWPTERDGSASADPFASPVVDPSMTASNGDFADPQEVLERVGVSFPKGASATYHPIGSRLVVVNTDEQLELIEIYLGIDGCGGTTREISICYETIEVEAALYHNWMFENRLSNAGHWLRLQTQEWLKAGEATVVETVVICARSGQRAKTESVSEFIYPGEPGTPEIPNQLHLEGKETKSPITPSMSSSFGTRNLGVTLEVDPVLGADDWTIDLNLGPQFTSLNGYIHWPPEGVGDPFHIKSQPIFHLMAVRTQITTISERYCFLGTTKPVEPLLESRKRPLLLNFVRADVYRPVLKKRKKVRKSVGVALK